MIINIGNHEFSEVWDGVFYKKLSDYPNISDFELKNIINFIAYEKLYNRDCEIVCENSDLLNFIKAEITKSNYYQNTDIPAKITECTACLDKGCLTEYVCHTTPLENAIKIFESGKLLSAVNARKMTALELQQESRNAANDPLDYFDYIMFSWGNCQAGDRLVMERKLNRFPTETDLNKDNFTPGIRFYFRYKDLLKHNNAVVDGVLPIKIKDELILTDWVYAIVIPTIYKNELEPFLPDNLKDKIIYLDNKGLDIWQWAEKVYKFILK